jgi:hypothetical protein
MKIELAQVCDGPDGVRAIVVRCRIGTAAGSTTTPLERLLVGKSYDAEIDIEYPLLLGENVWTTDERSYRLATAEATNTLVGEVDSLDDDGLVYFRLGVDALLMIEIVPVPQRGDWLRIEVARNETRFFLT